MAQGVPRFGGGKFLLTGNKPKVDPAGKSQGGEILGGGQFLVGYGSIPDKLLLKLQRRRKLVQVPGSFQVGDSSSD